MRVWIGVCIVSGVIVCWLLLVQLSYLVWLVCIWKQSLLLLLHLLMLLRIEQLLRKQSLGFAKLHIMRKLIVLVLYRLYLLMLLIDHRMAHGLG